MTSREGVPAGGQGEFEMNGVKIPVVPTKMEMKQLLECPVCLETLLPPVVLCEMGHTICAPCKNRLSSCPLCRAAFSKIPNLLAQELLANCRIPCRNREDGCQEVLAGADLASHLTVCTYSRVLVQPQVAAEFGDDDDSEEEQDDNWGLWEAAWIRNATVILRMVSPYIARCSLRMTMEPCRCEDGGLNNNNELGMSFNSPAEELCTQNSLI